MLPKVGNKNECGSDEGYKINFSQITACYLIINSVALICY